jgi:outer membrane protein OmpA-like peptidoglycan-associated protein
MSTLKHTSLLIALGLMGASICHAQGYSMRKGDKAYAGLAYHDAIAHYQEALKYGADSGACVSRLAESYLKVRDFHNAAKWYTQVCAANNGTPQDVYNYSQCLRATGNWQEADQWMKRYQAMAQNDPRAEEQLGAIHYARDLEARPIKGCIVKNVKENCTHADFGSAYWGDRLVFASARAPQASAAHRHSWDGDAFLDLYSGKVQADGELAEIKPMRDLNTSYHESNATFGNGGQEVWFTRNNYSAGHKGTSSDKVVKLKIYSRSLRNGKWTDERPFLYNSDEYSTGHPVLGSDGNTMYFASDMPGGQGGTDIWMVSRQGGGEWGKPVNLGSEVNTNGNEMFPFVDDKGTVYFSSDGHAGLGGLDIFSCNKDDGGYRSAANAGSPINSRSDDMALVMDKSGLKGYFSSDRSGGMGDDDLYSFLLAKPLGARMLVKGKAMEQGSKKPVEGVQVNLVNEQGKKMAEAVTDAQGNYTFDVDERTTYAIVSEESTYKSVNVGLATSLAKDTTYVRDLMLATMSDVYLWLLVSDSKTHAPIPGVDVSVREAWTQAPPVMAGVTETSGDMLKNLSGLAIGDSLVYDVRLEKKGYAPKKGRFVYRVNEFGQVAIHEHMDCSMQPMDVGMDLAKVIDIRPIHFDLGKHNIRKDAGLELDKIVSVMRENPTMEIELGSHTDARGSDASNAALSDRRAKSSAAYIVSKGIAAGRISGKGYGEARLLNRCANGVKCTEAEHQGNRRTEFIIVKM